MMMMTYLHGEDSTYNVKRRVSDIDARRVATRDEQRKHVQRHEIDDEHVAAPRCHHVKIRECCERRPQHRSAFDGAQPQPIRKDQRTTVFIDQCGLRG